MYFSFHHLGIVLMLRASFNLGLLALGEPSRITAISGRGYSNVFFFVAECFQPRFHEGKNVKTTLLRYLKIRRTKPPRPFRQRGRMPLLRFQPERKAMQLDFAVLPSTLIVNESETLF